MIEPHLGERGNPTPDGHGLRRYRLRWRVERLFAWLHQFSHWVIRWEYHVENFFVPRLHASPIQIFIMKRSRFCQPGVLNRSRQVGTTMDAANQSERNV